MTMKRVLVALIAAIYMAAPALAKTAKDFFIEDSTKVFPLLSKSLRMDMLDYYVSGQSVELENAFGGKSFDVKNIDLYINDQKVDIPSKILSSDDFSTVTINSLPSDLNKIQFKLRKEINEGTRLDNIKLSGTK